MATSIRLTRDLERLVTRLARKRKQTKSEIIRSALSGLAQEDSQQQRGASPYEAMRHLIGCASGGPDNLSQKTGEKFEAMLRGRKPRR